MENRKSLIFLLVFFFPFVGLAYNDQTTHPALTQEAVKLFQTNYPQKNLSADDILTIEKGSIEEDDPNSRCLYHFFDPVHNKGLLFHETSKNWAKNTNLQSKQSKVNNSVKEYFSSESDYSWDRGIYEYAHGDEQRGLETLGHIVHLIQDKLVPDHTRLDNHYFGSPYEDWTAQFTKSNIDIASQLIKEGSKPVSYSNLDNYFDNSAKYSNSNFFSLDTVFDKKFTDPTIKSEKVLTLSNGVKVTFGMANSSDNENFRLVQINKFRNLKDNSLKISYTFNDRENLIISDYWNLLSKQAVLNSAGVIKLFFDEVEKEKKSHLLLDKNKSFLKKTLGNLSDKTNTLLAFVRGTDSSLGEDQELPESNKKELETGPISSEPNLLDEKVGEREAINEMYKVLLDLEKQIKDLQTRLSLEESSPKELASEASLVKQQAITEIRNSVSGNRNLSEIIEILDQVEEDVSTTTDIGTTTPDVNIFPPIITEPNDLSQSFSTSTITFSGTASSSQVIFTDYSNVSTTVAEDGIWSLTLSDLVDGTNTINFFAKDSERNTSDPLNIVVLIVLEKGPPKLELKIDECTGAMFDDVCLAIHTNGLHFSWEIDQPGEYTYVLKNEWAEEVMATTTETSFIFNEDTYWPLDGIYSLTTYDQAGQVVASIESPRIQINNTLVINEVGWRGTSATDTREWIEIYNNGYQELSLDDFVIRNDSGQVLVELSGVISKRSYFLIERGDDTVISDVTANLISDFSVSPEDDALPDGEFYLELVRLFNGEEKIFDRTPNNFNPQTYCKNNEECRNAYKSTERCFPENSGDDLTNWAIGDNGWPNGLNSEGLEIQGTPGERNGHNRIYQI